MPEIYFATSRRNPSQEEESTFVVPELAKRGIEAEVAVWDDPKVDWNAAKLCVIRSTWDYHTKSDQFLSWLGQVSKATTLWNPAGLIGWNIHKGYLNELAGHGVQVVPTLVVRRGEQRSFQELLDKAGWNEAVIKPAISIGAVGTVRAGRDEKEAERHLDALLLGGDALIQPFVPSIVTEGEISLIFIDGKFAHAVLKKPGENDFRVQTQHGGSYQAFDPSPDLIALGADILSKAPHQTLYARVDLAEYEGAYHLMELELIEPRLFFTQNPSSVHTFCDALESRLRMI